MMYFTWIISAAIVACIAARTFGQSEGFVEEPSDVQVYEGQTGELKCIFSEPPTTSCFWSKNEQEVVIDNNGRYVFIGDPTSGDCSICISQSQAEIDDGLWACGKPQTAETSGLKSKPANYSVLPLVLQPEEPVIKVNGEPITNGSQIILDRCATQPSIECWSRGGSPGQASLNWTLGLTQEPLPGNYTITEDLHSGVQVSVAILQLIYDVDSDALSGIHILTCVANHEAYDHDHIVYAVLKKPEKTTKTTMTTKTYDDVQRISIIEASDGKDVTLSFDANGYPAPDLRLKRRKTCEDDWQDVEHFDAKWAAEYTVQAEDAQFMCVASNDNWVTTSTSEIIQIVTTSSSCHY